MRAREPRTPRHGPGAVGASASNNTTFAAGAGQRIETHDAQLAIEDATAVAASAQTASIASGAAVNLRILIATFR